MLFLAIAGCTSDSGGQAARPTPSAAGATEAGEATAAGSATPAPAAPGLTNPFGCGGGFTCATLEVPLDRADPAKAALSLLVATETGRPRRPAACCVVLAGGPGQAGVPLVERLVETLGADVVDAYRVAVLDQRGTGARRCAAPRCSRRWGSPT